MRRLSAEQKQLRGTYEDGKDHESAPVTIAPTTPEPPSWLSRKAKIEFRRVCNYLAQEQTEYLNRLDTTALASYAVNYIAWSEAEQHLAKHGPVIERPTFNKVSGNQTGVTLMKSPYLAISKERQMLMLNACKQLGFDPRSRQNITVPAPTRKKSNKPTAPTLSADELKEAIREKYFA